MRISVSEQSLQATAGAGVSERADALHPARTYMLSHRQRPADAVGRVAASDRAAASY